MRHRLVLIALLFLAAAASAQAPIEHDETPPSPSAWLEADYLYWWVSKGPNPEPLVTTGPATGFSGALGEPGTRVLFGQNPINFGGFSGLRMNVGFWLDELQDWGMEGSFFFLSPRKARFEVTSDADGTPIFAQPVNIPGLGERALVSSFPDQFIGSIRVDPLLRLYSWDVNGLARVYRGDNLDFDIMVGFRNLRLSEQLTVESNVIPLVPGALTFQGQLVPENTRVLTRDSFGASNDVYAGQVAARLRYTLGQFCAVVTAKVALGTNMQAVRIQGNTLVYPTTTATTPVRSAAGGILALPSNSPGSHDDARLVVVPEVAGRLSFDVLDWLRVTAGYGFLYVSEVARPGNQIDRTINPNVVPTDPAFGNFVGPNRPAFEYRRSTFWAHGVNAGMEFRF